MIVYKITYTAQAYKALLKMPRNTAQLIREELDELASDPFGFIPNAKKLQSRPACRLRVGGWKVIYEVSKEEITIFVMKIAPGDEVHK